jgi:hypothetical protein
MSPPHHQPLRQQLVRSVAEECGGPRAVPFDSGATTFQVFRIADGIGPTRNTYPLGDFQARSVEEALNEAIVSSALAHKDHLLIKVGRIAHLYAIRKRAAPRYVHKDHVTRREHDLYADHVCSFEAGAL